MSRERILLADDHALLLEAFKKLLEPAYHVVGTVTDGRALVEQVTRLRPDVVLVDIAMPKLNGLDACEKVKTVLPSARIVVLTMNDDAETAGEAIRRGALGYVLKKSASSELFTAIQTVLQGRIYITPVLSHGMTSYFVAKAKAQDGSRVLSLRQREVLQLLAEGRSMKEAADSLKVTPRTIAFHKYAIMEQTGIKTSAELVRYAMQLGIVRTKVTNPPPRSTAQVRP
jgi:DNA-binding NarL/FixJ family response regulator